jgi:hypothetical protein
VSLVVLIAVSIAVSICRPNMILIPYIVATIGSKIEHYILLRCVLFVVPFDIALCGDDIEPFCPSASVHIS